jgi:hypothetical protein
MIMPAITASLIFALSGLSALKGDKAVACVCGAVVQGAADSDVILWQLRHRVFPSPASRHTQQSDFTIRTAERAYVKFSHIPRNRELGMFLMRCGFWPT